MRFSVGTAVDSGITNVVTHLVLTRPAGEWVLSCTGGIAVHDESLAPAKNITCQACYTEAVRLIQENLDAQAT